MTVLSGESIPAYSHIQLIIPKSMLMCLELIDMANLICNRVLLATIRDKGICPCPRCLIPKEKLDKMGSKQDIKFRLNNPRKFLLTKIQTARRWIYEKALSITSQAVERLLKPFSAVPTVVCYMLCNFICF